MSIDYFNSNPYDFQIILDDVKHTLRIHSKDKRNAFVYFMDKEGLPTTVPNDILLFENNGPIESSGFWVSLAPCFNQFVIRWDGNYHLCYKRKEILRLSQPRYQTITLLSNIETVTHFNTD